MSRDIATAIRSEPSQPADELQSAARAPDRRGTRHRGGELGCRDAAQDRELLTTIGSTRSVAASCARCSSCPTRRRHSRARFASRPPRTCRPSSTTSRTPSSPWTMPATSRPSIPPASASSATRRRRSSAARSDFCCPTSSRHGVRNFLERLATKIDDTQVDLAAHQTWGAPKDGTRVAVEIAVSKAKLNRRDVYIVCMRDITERHARRAGDARQRGALPHTGGERARGDRRVRRGLGQLRRRQRQRRALLQDDARDAAGDRPGARSVPRDQPDGTPSFGVPRGYIDGALAGRRAVFEWMHRDADGHDMPCEVRLVRLPSSSRRLIRAQHHRHHRAQARRVRSPPASGGCSRRSPPMRR